MKRVVNSVYLLVVLCALGTAVVDAKKPCCNTNNTPSNNVNARNQVVATIPVGVTPAAFAVSKDGRTGYVVNSNDYGVEGGDSISVLDLRTNLVKATITDASFNQPSGIALSADGKKAYVTNRGGTTVSVINTATNAVTGSITGFDGPSSIVTTPTGNKAYVTNYGATGGAGAGNGTTVSLVDLNTNTITGTPITVGAAPTGLSLSGNGQSVFVSSFANDTAGAGSVATINTANNTVSNTTPGFFGPSASAVTRDGKYGYIANFGSNDLSTAGSTVSLVNLQNNQLLNTIDVGMQPSSIATSPDGRYAYVTNYNTFYSGPDSTGLVAGQGTVSIIDRANNTVVAPSIAVGQSPSSVTISPDGRYAYVTNQTSNTVSVVALNR